MKQVIKEIRVTFYKKEGQYGVSVNEAFDFPHEEELRLAEHARPEHTVCEASSWFQDLATEVEKLGEEGLY